MTVPKDRTYPASATNAAWQKKKGILDKAKSKTQTGLGDTLKLAEAAWKAVKWDDLDGSNKTAATPKAAQQLLDDANDALPGVATAKEKLEDAKEKAAATKANKALSKDAKTAAGVIETDLGKAITRLEGINVKDFETLVEKVQAETATTLKDISVSFNKAVVMTGTAATWDRKTLKVSGVQWKKGNAEAIKDKKVVVSAEKIASAKTEGGYLGFSNDMKLNSASGNTATFKSA